LYREALLFAKSKPVLCSQAINKIISMIGNNFIVSYLSGLNLNYILLSIPVQVNGLKEKILMKLNKFPTVNNVSTFLNTPAPMERNTDGFFHRYFLFGTFRRESSLQK